MLLLVGLEALCLLLAQCLLLAPPLSLALGLHADNMILLAAAAAAFVTTFFTAIAMPRKSLSDIVAYLMLPIGALFVSLIMLRSA